MDSQIDAIAAQFSRLPPHAIEAEICVLASMMLDSGMRDEVLGAIRRDDYFQADHRVIHDIIEKRHRAGKPVDAMMVRADLADANLLDEVGGMPYLAKIVDSIHSSAYGLQHAARVIETSRLRQIISASNDALRASYEPYAASGWHRVASKFSDELCNILAHGTTETIRHIRDVLDEALERKMNGKTKSVPVGLFEMDEMIGGLGLGKTTIVAGRPGSGKSQFGKQIALNIASAGVPVGIVSIEEDRDKIAANVMSNFSMVDNSKIVYERCDGVEWARVLAAVGQLQKLPLYLDDQCFELAQVESSIQRMAKKYGCKVVVVDYLQLIDPGADEKGMNREGEVRKLSNKLKLLFRRLGIAGLVCAQLNRASGSDAPQIHHLRESGAIEQDGDTIILLHRPDYYRAADPGFVPDFELHAIVGKNKNNATGMVKLHFNGMTQSITDRPGCRDPF